MLSAAVREKAIQLKMQRITCNIQNLYPLYITESKVFCRT